MSIGYTIQGQLKSKGKIDFGKTKLLVQAVIDDIAVSSTKVDANGKYELNFKNSDKPIAAKITVVPEEQIKGYQNALMFHQIIDPGLFQKNARGEYSVRYDLNIPPTFVNPFIHKSYHIHGDVAALGDHLIGAKIEFYEQAKPILFLPATPPLLEIYRGCAYTTIDGKYDFKFETTFWRYSNDLKADIFAKIYAFKDNKWEKVYDSPIYKDIAEDCLLNFFVPISLPPHKDFPSEGFLFTSVGLLPIDSVRISEGYATSMANDPVKITCQPFCETLRISGLFGLDKPVSTYKVDVVETNQWGNQIGGENPTPILDALWNCYWDDVKKVWTSEFLGPDSKGLYKNVDSDNAKIYCEPALKVSWDTLNGPSKKPNGYYQLIIKGYGKNGEQIATNNMPFMRISNNFVERVKMDIQAVDANKCGFLALKGSKIKLDANVFDPEGDVLDFYTVGTWGKDGKMAGRVYDYPRPNNVRNWNGDQVECDYELTDLSWEVSCPSAAYNFELHIQGSATNCYSSTLETQRVKKETNLVVSK